MDVYSVWAQPPEGVGQRLRKLMEDLRSEFGGPQFEPHVTIVGATELTEAEALQKLRSASDGLKAYSVAVDKVDTGTFFYQCVYLLLRPTPPVMEAGSHCSNHFGHQDTTPYKPHLSLLYGDLTDDEKKKAQEKARVLDPSVEELSFPITRLSLWRTNTEDLTLNSWQKVTEYNLDND